MSRGFANRDDRLRRFMAPLAAVAVFFPAIPYGGTLPWATSLIEIYAFGFLALISGLSLLQGLRMWSVAMGPVLAVWLLWILWLGLQCLPMDMDVLARASPVRAEQLRALFAFPWADETARQDHEVSSDVNATQARLLLSLALLAVFICSAWLSKERRARYWLLGGLVTAGVAQAALGGYDALTGTKLDIFGHSRAYIGMATGTFVNRNHLAGFLELSLASAAALSIVYWRRPRRIRAISKDYQTSAQRWRLLLDRLESLPVLLGLAAAVIFSGLALSQSRMGNFAAIAATALVGAAYLFSRGMLSGRRSWFAVFALTAFCVLVLSATQWEVLYSRYQQTDLAEEERWRLWPDLWAMMKAYAFSGSGLGTFVYVYPQFRSANIKGFYDHAHNDYAQFWIEAGVPGLFLLGLLVLLTFVHAVKGVMNGKSRSRRATHLAALVAMLAIAIHSIADFNLQIPANAIALTALMGASWGCSRTGERVSRRLDRGTPEAASTGEF